MTHVKQPKKRQFCIEKCNMSTFKKLNARLLRAQVSICQILIQ